VAGRRLVADGAHLVRDAVAARYVTVLRERLLD